MGKSCNFKVKICGEGKYKIRVQELHTTEAALPKQLHCFCELPFAVSATCSLTIW